MSAKIVFDRDGEDDDFVVGVVFAKLVLVIQQVRGIHVSHGHLNARVFFCRPRPHRKVKVAIEYFLCHIGIKPIKIKMYALYSRSPVGRINRNQ